MSEHSRLGASSAERWFACPGSVPLSASITPMESSYAKAGTAAHALATQCLTRHKNPHDFVGWYITQDGDLTQTLHKQYPIADFWIEVTPEMATAVDVYVEEVKRLAIDGGSRDTAFEVRFHLTQIDDELWGTADAVIYDETSCDLYVLDYKHGEGIVVDPENNPQLLYYAVGAAFAKSNRVVNNVHLAIIQPRAMGEDIKWWVVDAIDLLDFAYILETHVKLVHDAEIGFLESGLTDAWVKKWLTTGDHCKWCPAAGVCVKLAQVATVAPLDQFKSAAYNVDTLAYSLNQVKALKGWIKSVEDFAHSEMHRGVVVPGWKIVDKQARRDWLDTEAATKALLGDGRTEVEVMDPAALKSPAQVEGLLGKKDFAALVGDYVVSASSGTTIAPASDKRPALNRNLAADFEAVSS